MATYHYGTGNGVTSTVGERLAGLVQREIVVRTGLRDCRTHAKTWDLLRLTRMPAVRVEVGYLTSPEDRARLVDPLFREQVVEAIVAAVQRMYFPVEQDVPTGSIDVRAAAAGAGRRQSLTGRPVQPVGATAGGAVAGPDRAQQRLRAHRAEQLLQRVLDVGLPGQRGAQLQPQPRDSAGAGGPS